MQRGKIVVAKIALFKVTRAARASPTAIATVVLAVGARLANSFFIHADIEHKSHACAIVDFTNPVRTTSLIPPF